MPVFSQAEELKIRLSGLLRIEWQVRSLLILIICLSVAAAVAAGEDTDEDPGGAIEYLLGYVRASDVVFIRNNKEHTPEEAADHMTKKYNHYKRKIKTAEDFIEYAATKSIMSGKPYRVRLEDGTVLESAEWLNAALAEYRQMRKGAPSSATTEVRVSVLKTADSTLVVHRMEDFTRQYGDCEYPHRDCVSVSLRYPVLQPGSEGGLADSIRSFVRAHLLAPAFDGPRSASPEEVAAQFIREYKSLRQDMPDYSSAWTLERSVQVVYQTSMLVSLVFAEHVYSGGAHPNSSVSYWSLDASGRRILLADILTEGYEDSLDAIAEAEFRKIRGIQPGQSLDAAGYWFEGGRFRLNDNFAITGRGLAFYYNRYEIAPYAMGPTELVLGYDAIARLIREDVRGKMLPGD
jgi:hypothetical protein